jgi:hypothetical protein
MTRRLRRGFTLIEAIVVVCTVLVLPVVVLAVSLDGGVVPHLASGRGLRWFGMRPPGND